MAKGTHSYIQDQRNENIIIYINGEFFPRKEAKISVFDSGFLLGDGVWEGIRLYNKRLCFIDEHLERLYRGAENLKIGIGKSKEELIALIYETIYANAMDSDIHIRLIVSRGLKQTPYQHPNANVGGASIVIIPEYKKADATLLSRGIRLCLVDTVRGAHNSQDPRLNTLSKLNCIFGCLEADEKGFDEGIMLDMNGNVSTCNSTNFFIVKNGEVWTSTGEYCLPGITRGNIIKLCRENHIPVFEKNFQMKDVYPANEVFVTGTFAGVIPAIQVDDISIGNGNSGLITEKLYHLYKSKIATLYPGEPN
ncbi:MAG: aminotransferase class IV [Candidatus Marinimicrobia bacterium]|jgi:branched-chain amino acid aminotransferase|nr:aminotransferase class IV [Candidatus Neomarinimicrobiota bacterium]